MCLPPVGEGESRDWYKEEKEKEKLEDAPGLQQPNLSHFLLLQMKCIAAWFMCSVTELLYLLQHNPGVYRTG